MDYLTTLFDEIPTLGSKAFGDKIIIRTLGLYQPYATLMLPPYNKVETRLVLADRVASFPFGLYLFYSTKEPASPEQVIEWSGGIMAERIIDLVSNDPTFFSNGVALGIGYLHKISQPMYQREEGETFVLSKGCVYKNDRCYTQRLLYFSNQRRIKPFEFNYGKQGVGILPESEKPKIQFI